MKFKKRLNFKKIALYFLVLGISLVLFLGYLTFIRSKIGWDGRKDVNIAFVSDSFLVGNFSQDKKQVYLVSFPDDLVLEVGGGYGRYPVTSLWDLYEEEGQNPFKGIKKTGIDSLGVSIDGIIHFENEKELDDYLRKFSSGAETNFFGLCGYFFNNGFKTNMSFYDYFRLVRKLSSLRSSQIEVMNLGDGIIIEEELFDESVVSSFNEEVMDNFLREYFSDFEVTNEGLRIEIMNGTGEPFLAGDVARVINNMGGKVIYIGNTDKIKKSRIELDSKVKDSKTVKRVMDIFIFEVVEKEMTKNADISIFLGRDWLEVNLNE